MSAHYNRHYRYPWRDGNHYELLLDGRHFFPAMREAIAGAEEEVLLELYLFESGTVADTFIDVFTSAAQRGVQVSLLLDDYGAANLSRHDRGLLRRAGVNLAFYNPLHYGKLRRNLARDHRKLLLVDSKVAFVGGAGITDEFDDPDNPNQSWRETMVAIRGPVTGDWRDLFLHNWNLWSSPRLTPHREQLPPVPGGSPGRVTINAPSRMEIKRSLVKRIRNAERRVWIATAYFIPSLKIRRALKAAARSGIDVRLLLPGPITDHPAVRHASRRYYQRLLRHGIGIYEYMPRFTHTKAILCDNWVSIGSSNIDRWNLRWNLEANQEVESEEFAEEIERMLEQDFSESLRIDFDNWRHRPWYKRLSERFWGMIELWLERRSQ